MLHPSSSHLRNAKRPTRPVRPRSQSAAAVSQHLNRAHAAVGQYTFVHGRRRLKLNPVPFWIVVGTVAVMALWTIGTGTYFAFRQDVLNRLVVRHQRMQIAYEDRIAELRSQVDRITSRQLLDQDRFDRRLSALLKRQATLTQRTAALTGDLVTTGAIESGNARQAAAADPLTKTAPIGRTASLGAGRQAGLPMRRLPGDRSRIASAANVEAVDHVLNSVSNSLDKVQHRQSALLTGLQQHFDGKARRMRSVLDQFGVKAKLPPAEGGPYIPVKPQLGASAFDHQLYRVNIAREEVNHYRRALLSVPVRKPLNGDLEVSSGFGVRRDPFLGTPAMHTGLDLRGPAGKPVHATADGKVTVAGWDGGYGNLIEIDHGNGLSTRFGHLSEIDVKVGQKVHVGQVIGRIGSTGRSTGPHLHYETRINDEPVNPQKFLRAGTRLGGL